MNFQMTTALMATGEFHKGAGEYGLLGTMMAIGSLTGALLSARRGYPRRLVLVLAAASFALAEIAAGLMPTYWMFALWLPVVGISALTHAQLAADRRAADPSTPTSAAGSWRST